MAAEARLIVGQGLQGMGRIADNEVAVPAGDGPVIFHPFRGPAARLQPRGGRADLGLWLKVDALIFETAVIDADVQVQLASRKSTEVESRDPSSRPVSRHEGTCKAELHYSPTIRT
jgi:hypothetical protein